MILLGLFSLSFPFNIFGGTKGFSSPPSAPGNKTPVKIIVNDWTSQIVLARIYGALLEKAGHTVKYVSYTSNEQWGALNLGKAHVQVEVWEGTMAMMFDRMLKHGGVVDAGDHAALTREEWWYPEYVEKLVPGLPDWKALKKHAGRFAVPETAPKGLYLGGPWEKPDGARIRALEMDFKIIRVKHGNDLWVELEKAARIKRPIVLFNWTPNWVEAKFPGKFVEFPLYDPEIETDPSKGINPEFTHDCGSPRDGWLKKVTCPGFESRFPLAFNVLKEFNFTNQMIADIAVMVDYDKNSYTEAADIWLKTHKKIWLKWLEAARRNLREGS